MNDAQFTRRYAAGKFASLIAGTCVFCLAICLVCPVMAQQTKTGTLIIKITGLTSNEGQARVAVFDSKESWLKKPVYKKALKIEKRKGTWSLKDVPYGDYGIAVYHDQNGNAKKDSNLMGRPLEPNGFSNNARGRFGPAKWDKAKFAVSAPTSEIEIAVK